MRCHFLLQGIFLTQGSNLHLLCLIHCRGILYYWAIRGNPKGLVYFISKQKQRKMFKRVRLIKPIVWRRKWQPTLVFWPGESHGRRSLVGYSPRGCKESETTEQLNFHFSFFHSLVGFVRLVHFVILVELSTLLRYNFQLTKSWFFFKYKMPFVKCFFSALINKKRRC